MLLSRGSIYYRYNYTFPYTTFVLSQYKISCGNKMPTRCNRWIFIANLIACSTCFGHHYAHHQELESIIQVVVACRIWYFGFQVVFMMWSWGLCVRFAGCCRLLMMGIMVSETCWASNKICNKNSSVASSWHFISTHKFEFVVILIPYSERRADDGLSLKFSFFFVSFSITYFLTFHLIFFPSALDHVTFTSNDITSIYSNKLEGSSWIS